jgi:hypothetical protein
MCQGDICRNRARFGLGADYVEKAGREREQTNPHPRISGSAKVSPGLAQNTSREWERQCEKTRVEGGRGRRGADVGELDLMSG